MNNHRAQKKWTPKETVIAIRMFENNKTHKEIAETLGRTSPSVMHRLNKLGFKRDIGSNQYSLGMPNPNPMQGKHHSEETKQKISAKAKARYSDMTKHPSWKGGRRVSSSGYIEVLNKNHPRSRGGYVFEHILVMERMLDRYLTRDEVVHHINQNKQDNRVENLMLFKNRRDHSAYHKNLRILELEDYYESSSADRKING